MSLPTNEKIFPQINKTSHMCLLSIQISRKNSYETIQKFTFSYQWERVLSRFCIPLPSAHLYNTIYELNNKISLNPCLELNICFNNNITIENIYNTYSFGKYRFSHDLNISPCKKMFDRYCRELHRINILIVIETENGKDVIGTIYLQLLIKKSRFSWYTRILKDIKVKVISFYWSRIDQL